MNEFGQTDTIYPDINELRKAVEAFPHRFNPETVRFVIEQSKNTESDSSDTIKQ